MLRTTFTQRRGLEQLSPEPLARYQLERLNELLVAILPYNHFYGEKLANVELPLRSLDQLASLPYTFKDELAAAPHHRSRPPKCPTPTSGTREATLQTE